MKTFRKQENVADYSLEQLPKTKPLEVNRIKKYVGGSKIGQLQSAYNMCEYSDLKNDFLSDKYYQGTLKSSILNLTLGFLGFGWYSVKSIRIGWITFCVTVGVILIHQLLLGGQSIAELNPIFFLVNICSYFWCKSNIRRYNTLIGKAILDGVPPSKFPTFAEYMRNKVALLELKYHAK